MTDEATALVEGPRFSIRRVLGDSFETLVRTAPRLLAIVLILAVPLFVWLILGGQNVLIRFAAGADDPAQSVSSGAFDPATFILGAILSLIGLGIHAAVSDAAFQDMLGEEGDILQSLARALVVAPSLIGVALFWAVLFGISLFVLGFAAALLAQVIHWSFGLGLLAVGLAGLALLAVQWWLVIPAIVVETANPIECFRRSMFLTSGHRWRVFALLLAIYLPQLGVNAVLLLATQAVGMIAVAVLNIVLTGLFVTFNAVTAVTAYGHLRAIKEGSGAATLAEVFE